MLFNIISLFPEFFVSPLSCGLMDKAVDNKLVAFNVVNPRDNAPGRHKCVDDRPYGGGPGMVMALDPLLRTLRDLERPGRVLMMSPSGRPLDQALVRELAAGPLGESALTLICGRYEGIDARLKELFPIEEISVGDFVLNGGEAAALCVIESVARLLPGFMGHAESGSEESFSGHLLEYPHYTRPEEFEGLRVPDILLSGDHAKVARWRRDQALGATLKRRPDLLDATDLDRTDLKVLRSLPRRRPGRNLFLALVHYPVLNKFGKVSGVSLTNMDVHDIARVSRTYGLGGYFITTPLEDQRRLAHQLVEHWLDGPGCRANPDRTDAVRLVRVLEKFEDAVAEVESLCGRKPMTIGTSARPEGTLSFGAVRDMLDDSPVLLVLGTASGLDPAFMKSLDGVLRPVRMLDEYNHLSVRSATAIMVDRLLGDTF